MWVLFVVFSGGSVGCAGVGTVNLGLECWRPPPGRRRNWLKWWIFPLVVVGIALAPLVLAYYLWTCWRAGSGAGEGEKDGDIEMGTDVRKGEGGSDLSGETLTNPILKIIAGCEEGKK